MQDQLSLLELNRFVKQKFSDVFNDYFWVVAEISEMNENRSGHCYLELIEKDLSENKIVAKARANIWANSYRFIKPYFESVTKRKISSGIKILFKASVEFHEIYGYSLTIVDLDPNYTLGDLARKRQEIIAQLEEEGVFDMNRETEMPIVVQKIAIISSETAAGYGDFIDQLTHNSFGYKFYIKLFPSAMQGEKTEESIINALEKILEWDAFFDVVVIIRGGGSKAELSSFDSYLLAASVAQFPLPVIAGIGHERDESIVDLVAHTSVKTPTAVAEFLISKCKDFETEMNEYKELIKIRATEILQENKIYLLKKQSIVKPLAQNYIHRIKQKLQYLSGLIPNRTKNALVDHKNQLSGLKSNLLKVSQRYFTQNEHQMEVCTHNLKRSPQNSFLKAKIKLQLCEKTLELSNPQNILNKGYSITLQNGKILKSANEINPFEILITQMKDGIIKSQVIDLQNEKGTVEF